MNYPFQITLKNHRLYAQICHDVKVGHYFVFVEDQKALPEERRIKERLIRLQVERARKVVLPLVEKPVELEGVTITPESKRIDPIGAVVADRDLYRAEQDNVHLFIAFPSPPEDLHLIIEYNGELFADRKVELRHGVGIETFSMLLSGSYTAYVSTAGRRIGTPVSFTVAEYTLAPLSGRLVSHKLNRDTEEFSFELAVESYQVPFDGSLMVALIESGREVTHTSLDPLSPGRYAGSLEMNGEGPFRLRLMASDDPERMAEITIPGSRKVERQATVISELGTEQLFSMMPEAEALPIRGGYLSERDFLATPLRVETVVAERRIIHANTDVESLVLVSLDLTNGKYTEQNVGDVAAGNEIAVNANAPINMVFVGCFVHGQPFEAYTTFMTPSRLGLSVEAPETIRPREDLVLRLRCEGANGTTPILLSVRDERLTATDTPGISLGAATKRGLDRATEDMAERAFTSLSEHVLSKGKYARSLRYRDYSVVEYEESFEEEMMLSSLSDESLGFVPESLEIEDLAFGGVEVLEEVEAREIGELEDAIAKPLRSEFPEVLFYDIVSFPEIHEVIVPLGDSLTTLSVEAFVLAEGDWIQSRSTVVVDQAVRIDLELPPAIYPGDQVLGRLRAATASREACVTLKRDGQLVPLRPTDKRSTITAEHIVTPVELEFDAQPGSYIATVEDLSTGKTDSVKVLVAEPGKFKSYAKELGLLYKGEYISLNTSGALSLRLLPAIDEPFDTLITATAGYTHLCCEQTAAKILAAVFMYLTAKNQGQRSKAEQIILAGIAREQKMIRPRGFAMYPDDDYISEHYSTLAVRYLWKLKQLDEIPDLSLNLRQEVREGLLLADLAAEAHQMKRLPDQIHCIEDAYAVATAEGDPGRVQTFIESLIDFSNSQPSVKNTSHAVFERAVLAYAAASSIAIDDMRRGIPLANSVTRQFNEQGSLYSTVDSVAAIALMIQLRLSGVVTGEGRVRINNQEMSTLEASQFSDRVESIEVLDGIAAIEVMRIHEEDWGAFAYAFPSKVGFRDSKGNTVRAFRAGDRAELMVSLPDGYQSGDIVHVALPACMSWIQGGGQVKRFTLDFAGKNELQIPVVVTSNINGEQHFAVCVRNMFKEERATNPGILSVKSANLIR